MDRILFINACVRPESRTYVLAKQVLERMEGEVEEVNLEQEGILPLDRRRLEERDICVRQKDFTNPMFRYALQFANADVVVIAAPYWDLSFPASMKIYFEAVTVDGLTFMYSPEGNAMGLCRAKKIVYVTTAGGTIGELHLGYDYIKALAGTFYGIPEFLCFKAENLDIKGADVKKIMEEAMAQITSYKDRQRNSIQR